jgi:hypothetical protein
VRALCILITIECIGPLPFAVGGTGAATTSGGVRPTSVGGQPLVVTLRLLPLAIGVLLMG